MALRLRALGRLLSIGKQPGASAVRDDAAGAVLKTGRRNASPQPVEAEEAAAHLRPPLEAQPVASTSGRYAGMPSGVCRTRNKSASTDPQPGKFRLSG